jgi:hypothetical protein
MQHITFSSAYSAIAHSTADSLTRSKTQREEYSFTMAGVTKTINSVQHVAI